MLNNKNENGEPICYYVLKDSSDEAISDGGWYRDADTPDTMGGFFGGTKFYYGEGEEDYFIGTSDKNVGDGSFIYISEYEK